MAAGCEFRCQADGVELEQITMLNRPHSFLLSGQQHWEKRVWLTVMTAKKGSDEREDEEREMDNSEEGGKKVNASSGSIHSSRVLV